MALLADEVGAELLAVIRGSITARDTQTMIGPSGIGVECTRQLIPMLLGQPQPDNASRWKAQVGTAIHVALAGFFTNANARYFEPRWLLEQAVNVGEIAGQPITGSCDLFDVDSGTVVDWKTTGVTRLKKYKRDGPGNQYRVQAHLYGRGYARLGYPVRNVMLVFLPRDGELGTTFVWHEPYDERIAIAALDRCTGVLQLVSALGQQPAADLYPLCANEWCTACPTRKPYGATPRSATSIPTIYHSVAELFASARRKTP